MGASSVFFGGYRAVAMVVPVLAFFAGGYLTVAAQYGIAIGLMVITYGVASRLNHRRMADDCVALNTS